MRITEQTRWLLIFCTCCLLLVAGSTSVLGKSTVVIDTKTGVPIELTINRLAKLHSSENVLRAHVVNPDIAEIIYSQTQSPEWVFVSGKSIGTTQLTLWGNNNKVLGTFEVIVRPDVNGLKKHLHEIFPDEMVYVRNSADFLTLTGTISGAVTLQKILAVAESYAPEKIINLMQVGGIQQVMLEVRIAEISKNVGHQLGINFAADQDNGFGLSMLDSLTAIPGEGWPGNPLSVSTAVNAVIGIFHDSNTYLFALDALQEEGLLQILAKPTLITQSGQSASFLAGGEFPFPVAQSLDRFSIEWKSFGVGLNFTPTVLGKDRISLLVSPEVSELDFTNTVSYGGYVVPALDTRRMSTVVELGDNQSFAIAGLLKNYVRESVAKFPILGDIPIIGALFRSTKYQNDETELVVVVTPHLVKPVDGDKIPLPTDSLIKPDPFELMLFGMLEGRPPKNREQAAPETSSTMESSMEGDFGYIIPE